MAPKAAAGDALGTIQRLGALFHAANSAGDDGDGPLCAAARLLTPAERAELGSVRDQKGRTLLHHAAAGGSAEAVRRVLNGDYDPESKGADAEAAAATPAAADAKQDASRPPLDERDGDGSTALALAAGAGALPAVELLLARGACPQGRSQEVKAATETEANAAAADATANPADAAAAADAPLTPLHRAAAATGPAGAGCLRRLLAAGARVDAPSGAAGTPLGMAALARNAEGARLLLEAGADPDGATLSGVTPLTMAAANADEALAAVLLDAGADPKRAAHGGMTPLHALAAAGLRRRRRQGIGAEAAAEEAKEAQEAGVSAARLARLLLDKGADADALDGGGTLAAVLAAACGPAYRPLVDALIPATTLRPAGFSNIAEGGTNKPGGGEDGDGAKNAAGDGWTAENLARYAEAQVRLQEREYEAARAAAEARVASAVGAGAGGAAGAEDDSVDAAGASFAPPPPEVSPPDEAKGAEVKAQGDAAFVKGAMRGAEKLYTEALKHWTGSAPLWANRAAARLALAADSEGSAAAALARGALSDARAARSLQPDYVKAWYREGSAASALGMWRAACGALGEASRLDPDNDDVGAALERAVGRARREAQQQQAQQQQAQQQQGRGQQQQKN